MSTRTKDYIKLSGIIFLVSLGGMVGLIAALYLFFGSDGLQAIAVWITSFLSQVWVVIVVLLVLWLAKRWSTSNTVAIITALGNHKDHERLELERTRLIKQRENQEFKLLSSNKPRVNNLPTGMTEIDLGKVNWDEVHDER